MVFSSLSFILCFLPLLAIFYFSVPKRYIMVRRYILLAFSLIFYAWGEPIYIFVILLCVFLTWLLSKGVENKKKIFMLVALAVNILPLIVFKYLEFVITNVNLIPAVNIPAVSLTMPIGISFYTFQMLTYIIDLYRGDVKRQKNFCYLALYIFLFPQLIAGPIVRYSDIEADIGRCNENMEDIKYGIGRFVIGLSKKVLIANQVSMICDSIVANDISHISVPMMWLAVIAYTMQIYFDFSGYSDMAIGLGRMFGFRFPENFDLPYSSTSISEFWRRWHISMNTFFRDYVYIPLGGNRCNRVRWLFNVLVVWCLTGLWHGAYWNFVIWGLYYALLLTAEKLFLSNLLKRIPSFFSWVYTMFCTVIGWSIFMNDSNAIGEIFNYTRHLFGFGEVNGTVTVRSLDLGANIMWLLIAVIVSLPTRKLFTKIHEFILKRKNNIVRTSFDIFKDLTLVCLLMLCIVRIVGGSYNPFIYFRF